ncbi:MAG: hypothetical protein EBY46_11685, partial [Rhodobacteraceae bacterium]|nr:hypothetical protein [Paracoccaceae bacterium]
QFSVRNFSTPLQLIQYSLICSVYFHIFEYFPDYQMYFEEISVFILFFDDNFKPISFQTRNYAPNPTIGA